MKVQFSSLSYLQNWKTRFVYFLLIPFIETSLLILVNAQYTNRLQWPVAIASMVLSGGTLSMSTIAQLFVMDRNLKIDQEMAVNRPFSFNYWGTKIATSISVGLTLIIINLVILSIFQAPLFLIIRALTMAPIIVLSGTVVGFLSVIAAWRNGNPYFYLNILASLTSIVSGVLILVDRYPFWLKALSYLFPFSQTIKFVITGTGKVYIDLAIDLIWILLGLSCYVTQLQKILKHPTHLW
ncbi:antibiotic transporter permease [Levilactobacillus tujiorum]|uniref:Antibiotic transporter permease n=1 Tax=Levilactobacillus tujiorum TaxID=2912243 RepID=A0ABX1L587_9LACO|nr:antibiotic transporter permease [Levilactobacillus tujiorum]MCH5465249.1 antibiotic transporter permease [Levilactobacillus tujiorum]NLR12538.1 antibiotic transporter permease [Lactobacillus sp. HBUAS51387]NLR30206.1 antibiotic transporter permease [Levilactobacillus tujiorum]